MGPPRGHRRRSARRIVAAGCNLLDEGDDEGAAAHMLEARLEEMAAAATAHPCGAR